jgi:putative inorganic carbon (hco3(-)) transporter
VPLRGILLLAIVIPSLPVCFFRPYYGVVLWTIFAFLNPQQMVWSAADVIPWAFAIGLVTLGGLLFFGGNWTRGLANREFILLLILWVWFSITSIISAHTPLFEPHVADTYYRWQLTSKIMLMAAVTMGVVDGFARLRILILAIAGSFAFYILKALPFLVITGGSARIYGPMHSMIADNNDFGLALNMTLPLFLFLAQTEAKPWLRRACWFLFFATIPTIFFTYSRGAMVGLCGILALMLLQLKQRVFLLPVAAVGFALVVLFAPAQWKDRMDLASSDALDASAHSRLNAWQYSWRLANDYPITGGGFEAFTPELFRIYATDSRDVHGPHSIYFGVMAEHGFVGLFLYTALLVTCFGSLRKVRKLARWHEDRVALCYANMFRFSLVGFLVSGTFLGRAYFDYFFTIVACTSILKRICLTAWTEQPAEEMALSEVAAQ